MKIDAIMIKSEDNVATALRDLQAGESATTVRVTAGNRFR